MLALGMLNSSNNPAVGIDLGGTSVKAALVSPHLEILEHEAVPTDTSSQAALLDSIVALVARVRGEREIAGVGFGLPSQINQITGEVADSTNVPIAHVAFRTEMQRRLSLAVEVDNDANVAGYAETLVGSARGMTHVIMLTLGTGVGGAIVSDGKIYRGATGFAGELGHMVVAENGPRCQGHCPNHGCLEVMASAVGVLHAANEVADQHPAGTLAATRSAGLLDVHHVIDQALRRRRGLRSGARAGRPAPGRGDCELHQHLQPAGGCHRRGDLGRGRSDPGAGQRRGRGPRAARTAGRVPDPAGQARQRGRGARRGRAHVLVSGRLVVCPTPIGNLGDITLRTLEALRAADVIACEDTRRTRTLCTAHKVDTPLVSLHQHNEAARSTEIVRRIEAGETVALVSDAGMPLISDPGARVVAAAVAAGCDVDVLPGPSAVVTAAALSGLGADGFCFGGFLPRAAGARRAVLERLDGAGLAVIVFESPNRLASLSEAGCHRRSTASGGGVPRADQAASGGGARHCGGAGGEIRRRARAVR